MDIITTALAKKLGGISVSKQDIAEAVEGYLENHPEAMATTDDTLSVSGIAADAKEVGDLIDAITPGSWSDEAKDALLACFQHVAWLDDDDDYYGNLRDALYKEEPDPQEGTVEISSYVIGNFSSANNQIQYDGIAVNRIFPNPIIYKTRPGNVTYTATLNNSNYRVTIGRIKSTAENDSLVTQGVTKIILSSFTERDGSLPWIENSASLNVEGYDYIMPVIKRADNGNMTSADLQAVQSAYTLTWRVQEDG